MSLQGAVTLLTTILLWSAAAGGTLLLLLHLLAGTPARWLWVSAPLAWIALWGWHRRRRRQAPSLTARAESSSEPRRSQP